MSRAEAVAERVEATCPNCEALAAELERYRAFNLQCDGAFGLRRHQAAEEARPAPRADRRGSACGAPGEVGGRAVRCNLPAGHGGNHVLRTERSRVEVERDGSIAHPTTEFATVATWSSGGRAAVHMGRRLPR